MTHELKKIIAAFERASVRKEKCVLATVVDIEGSSYRRPGVKMLITQSGKMTGAISGGCVEKDVIQNASSVFTSGKAKMMSYNGKFRLGCEGTLYILLELFNPAQKLLDTFKLALSKRSKFASTNYYTTDVNVSENIGSFLCIENQYFPYNRENSANKFPHSKNKVLLQELDPLFHLMIFGAEHDAAKLATQASILGWEVSVITSPLNTNTIEDFPGANHLLQINPDQIETNRIDEQTAIVLMSHNYAKDLHYLLAIKDCKPCYVGLLGPVKRRNNLLDDFLEQTGNLPEYLADVIHGPTGLNIGAETAEEIALSICSEIICIQRNKNAIQLKNLKGEIHYSHLKSI